MNFDIEPSDCCNSSYRITSNPPAIHECSDAGRGVWLWPLCCGICYCTGIWRAPRSISLHSRENASLSVELFWEKADINVSIQKTETGYTESTVKSVDEVPVYCVCRMPELPNTRWIECSGCKRWYHTESCINVPHTALSSNTTWYCNRRIWCVTLHNLFIFIPAYILFVMHDHAHFLQILYLNC